VKTLRLLLLLILVPTPASATDSFEAAVDRLRNETGAAQPTYSRDADGRPDVWLIGDSITYDYEGFVAAEHPEWDVTQLGQGGETSLAALDRILPLLDQATGDDAPEVCVILYGTNDIALHSWWLQQLGLWDPATEPAPTLDLPADHPFRTEAVVPRLMEIYDACRAKGAEAILGLPIGFARGIQLSPFAGWFDDQFLAIRLGIHRERVPTVDFRLTRVDDYADAFHPTPWASEHLFAPRVGRAVKRALRRLE